MIPKALTADPTAIVVNEFKDNGLRTCFRVYTAEPMDTGYSVHTNYVVTDNNWNDVLVVTYDLHVALRTFIKGI